MFVDGVMDRRKDRQHYAIMNFFFLQNVRIKLNTDNGQSSLTIWST